MKLSIILPTYNSEIEKIFLSLDSILKQNESDYEIIITDDGSKKFEEDKIVDFFKQNKFYNYQIIIHKENIGTVRNIQNAYRKAKAEYIFSFGPGDCLYEENSLKKFYSFLNKSKPLFGFARFQSYFINDGKIIYNDFQSPPERIIYRYSNFKKAFKYMVLYNTYCCGASLFFNKNLITQDKYLFSSARYCEDLVQVLLVNDSIPLSFYDEKLLFYEFGSGISSKSSTFNLIQKDHLSFYLELANHNPQNKILKRKLFLNKLCMLPSFLRKICRIIFSLDFYLFILFNKIGFKKKLLRINDFKNIYSFWS